MLDDNIISICHLIVYAIPLESNLYPFGAEVGDKGIKMDTEDGNSPYITPPMGFPFMGKLYDRVYVSTFI